MLVCSNKISDMLRLVDQYRSGARGYDCESRRDKETVTDAGCSAQRILLEMPFVLGRQRGVATVSRSSLALAELTAMPLDHGAPVHEGLRNSDV